MFKIVVFVPKDYSEKVKEAMFKAGAGKYKNYDCCSFEVEGVGQFRPIKDASPFLGKLNTVEKVKELKIEMICVNHCLKTVIKAMKMAHPYQEVAYDIISLVETD